MKCLSCHNEIEETAHYGLHGTCFFRTFDLEELHNFVEFRRIRSTDKGSLEDIEDSSRDAQFHGNYPKFSARLNGQRYILKYGKSSYPLIAQTEAICNRLGEILDLPVAKPFALIIQRERQCFVVRDFLSSRSPQNLLHVWDIWPHRGENKEAYFLDILLNLIRDELSFHDASRVAELIIFDYLIGNDDRHRGNIGIIESGGGKRKLAPFYDNVSALGIEDPEFLDPTMKWHPSTRIQLRSAEAGIDSYLSEITSLGFGESIKRIQSRLRAC